MKSASYKIFLVATLALFSCSDSKNQPELKDERVDTEELNDQSTSEKDITANDNSGPAKTWLKSAVEEYFNQELNDRSFMTTWEYDEYKTDMINSIYSHGIDMDSLKKKWSYKYEVTEKRKGVGFLIGAQDYYNIIIKTCKELPSQTKGEYLFKLILCDTGYNNCYESDVTVIKYNGSYAIDNVKEYFR